MGNDKYDKDGRLVVAEYEKYQVVAVYVPNAGRGLVNLPSRMEWDKDFTDFLVVSFTFNITYLPRLFATLRVIMSVTSNVTFVSRNWTKRNRRSFAAISTLLITKSI